jgi:hypothetical protein
MKHPYSLGLLFREANYVCKNKSRQHSRVGYAFLPGEGLLRPPKKACEGPPLALPAHGLRPRCPCYLLKVPKPGEAASY